MVSCCFDSLGVKNITLNFKIVWPCIVKDFLWIKPTDVLISNVIGITTLHVSGNLSAHHQEFLAVHRLWYILCSCDEAFATRSRMKLHKMYQSRCTAKNSWWWAEGLPETCRVVIPIIWNSVHLLVLFTRNLLLVVECSCCQTILDLILCVSLASFVIRLQIIMLLYFQPTVTKKCVDKP